MERTKGTWAKSRTLIDQSSGLPYRVIIGPDMATIAKVTIGTIIPELQEANADFICKAVNNHDRLVELMHKYRNDCVYQVECLLLSIPEGDEPPARFAHEKKTIEKIDTLLKEEEG